MVESFKGLFGGGEWEKPPTPAPAQKPAPWTQRPDVAKQAGDFSDRYAADPGGSTWSAAEAKAMLDQLAKVAPPDVMRRALEQTLQNMTPEQRAELFLLMMGGQTGVAPAADPGTDRLTELVEAAAETPPDAAKPNPLDGVMDSPLSKVLAGGVAAFAIKEILKGMGR